MIEACVLRENESVRFSVNVRNRNFGFPHRVIGMSNGLGRVQLEILLLVAKFSFEDHRAFGFDLWFPVPVANLRSISRKFAEMHNGYSHCHLVKPAVAASFSRAVRGLVKRGLLVPVRIPWDQVKGMPANRTSYYHRHQIRFVKTANGVEAISRPSPAFRSSSKRAIRDVLLR